MATENLSAPQLIDAFKDRLIGRRADIGCIAAFRNSFEGWLKWELALALSADGSRRPWTADGKWDAIGVEYKAPLGKGAPRKRKHVDLWVCSTADGTRWHFVELKVAFCDANARKQIASWRRDLALLRQAADPDADCGIALLVAVDFDEQSLDAALAQPEESTIETVRSPVSKQIICDADAEGRPRVWLVSATTK